MKHTPEPWEAYEGGGVRQQDGTKTAYVCYCCRHTIMEKVDVVQDANARRIAATVNACRGIPTESLAPGIVAELVAACEAAGRLLYERLEMADICDDEKRHLQHLTDLLARFRKPD